MTDAPGTTRGFTLIEQLVTLAIAVILLTVAVPNYQMFVANSRMASQANEVVGALSLARSEAVKRGTQVSVPASSRHRQGAGHPGRTDRAPVRCRRCLPMRMTMKQSGFTLLEVLVAVLVLAVIRPASVRNNQSAYQRTQATWLAYD